tara:strand:+ start:3335 stop:3958 length:624 start_codon:yes stop_codon:yes gene_type:complete
MLEFSPLCLARLNKDSMFTLILENIDSVHLDIMDGEFVPNTAFSVTEINEFECNVPKHVHIMSWNPLPYINELENVDSISFHYEVGNCKEYITKIKEKNMQAGLVINPTTPVEAIYEYIPLINRVIIMAVKPGFSGQGYLDSASKKISDLREFSSTIEIAIDGGMNEETIANVKSLGADSFVVCSVIAKSNDVKAKIDKLKSIWNQN